MKNLGLIANILLTGLIAGTMDILAAIFILAGGNAVGVFKGIASGAFGRAALDGGTEMVIWGAAFHYFIALSWTAAYFVLYPRLPFLKTNKWLNGVAYGIVVWSFMNLIVLPLIGFPQRFSWTGVLTNIAILIVCIGTPVAVFAEKFYSEREISY